MSWFYRKYSTEVSTAIKGFNSGPDTAPDLPVLHFFQPSSWAGCKRFTWFSHIILMWLKSTSLTWDCRAAGRRECQAWDRVSPQLCRRGLLRWAVGCPRWREIHHRVISLIFYLSLPEDLEGSERSNVSLVQGLHWAACGSLSLCLRSGWSTPFIRREVMCTQPWATLCSTASISSL